MVGSDSTSITLRDRTRGISDPKPSWSRPWFRSARLPVRRRGRKVVDTPSVSGLPVTVVRSTLLNVLDMSKFLMFWAIDGKLLTTNLLSTKTCAMVMG